MMSLRVTSVIFMRFPHKPNSSKYYSRTYVIKWGRTKSKEEEMEVFPSIEDLRMWADRLEEVQKRLAPYFERAEPRQRAMAYIRGLLSTTERKNGWQLAEVAGGDPPHWVERPLHTPAWESEPRVGATPHRIM